MLRWAWLLWLGVGMCAVGHAQDDFCKAGSGSFSINGVAGNAPYVGCAPLAITLTNTAAGTEKVSYDYDYKGEKKPDLTSKSTITYEKPGRYIILQVGSGSAGEVALCREVFVKDITPPKARAVSCPGDDAVRLVFADDSITRQYDQIEVRWNDGSPAEHLYKGHGLELKHRYAGSGTRNVQYRGVYVENPDSCPGSEEVSLSVEINGGYKDKRSEITQIESRTDGSVLLTAEGVQGLESEVLVKTATGTYRDTGVKIARQGTVELTLQSPGPNQVHCYKLRTMDACGVIYESNEVCAIKLTGQAENERSVLVWSRYPHPQDSVRFELLRDGNLINTTSNRSELSYEDKDVECGVLYRYQVVTVVGEKSRSLSAPVELSIGSDCPDAAPFFPDAFSPNGDGLNDRFKPEGTFLDDFQMIIYNRWGQAIFQTTRAAEGWDGTVGGSRAPQGVYAYKVVVSGKKGEKYLTNGTVRLLR